MLNRHLPTRISTALAATVVTAVAVGGISSAAPMPKEHPRHGHHLPSKQEIRDQFELWNDALATGDPERVADRYAAGAVLLPTMSNEVRTDRAGIVDYFEHFLEGKPVGEVTESHVKVLNPRHAVDAGTYRFELTDEDGEKSTLDARYDFVYEKGKDGTWKIVEHHSSAMPED